MWFSRRFPIERIEFVETGITREKGRAIRRETSPWSECTHFSWDIVQVDEPL
jgi:hypothetical protein